MSARGLPAFIPAIAFLFFFGCATRIPVTVTKPAEVNMAATRKVAVLDFEVVPEARSYRTEDLLGRALEKLFRLERREKTLEERISQYATERVILTLIDTNYFQVVSPREVREVMRGKSGRGVDVTQIGNATGVLAVISGEIYLMQSEDEETVATEEVKNPDTGIVYKEIRYWVTRTARLGLEYAVVNADTGAIIATRSFEKTLQEKKEGNDLDRLPKPEEMYESIIDSFMTNISRQLAPYKVRESRRLMKDRDSRMEEAARLARSGVYDEALAIYLEIWEVSKNPAAGYNGAIVYEVTGDLDAAIALMKLTVSVSNEKRVVREYRRLLLVKEERKRLEEQLAGEN
jgi:tetratricopeptide (TPR) repeat protein